MSVSGSLKLELEASVDVPQKNHQFVRSPIDLTRGFIFTSMGVKIFTQTSALIYV